MVGPFTGSHQMLKQVAMSAAVERYSETQIFDLALALTALERGFADQWLIDHNASRAYRHIHPDASPQTYGTAGQRVKRRPHVWSYICARMGEMSSEAGFTGMDVLREDARIAFSDIRELFSPEGSVVAPQDLPDEIASAVASVEITEKVIRADDQEHIERKYKYKLSDKGAALKRLGEYAKIYGRDPKDAAHVDNSITMVIMNYGTLDPNTIQI